MVATNTFMRKNFGAVQVTFILDLDIFADDCKVCYSAPFPNGTFPAQNTSIEESVPKDFRACQ